MTCFRVTLRRASFLTSRKFCNLSSEIERRRTLDTLHDPRDSKMASSVRYENGIEYHCKAVVEKPEGAAARSSWTLCTAEIDFWRALVLVGVVAANAFLGSVKTKLRSYKVVGRKGALVFAGVAAVLELAGLCFQLVALSCKASSKIFKVMLGGACVSFFYAIEGICFEIWEDWWLKPGEEEEEKGRREESGRSSDGAGEPPLRMPEPSLPDERARATGSDHRDGAGDRAQQRQPRSAEEEGFPTSQPS